MMGDVEFGLIGLVGLFARSADRVSFKVYVNLLFIVSSL